MIQPINTLNARWPEPESKPAHLRQDVALTNVRATPAQLVAPNTPIQDVIHVSPVPFEQLPFKNEQAVVYTNNRPLLIGKTPLAYAWVEEKDVVLPEKEPWTREGPIRYLGYANEVGAALKELIGNKLFQTSNIISGLYGVVDAWAASKDEYEQSKNLSKQERNKRVAKVAVDATLFQVVASVLIPPKVIEGITKLLTLCIQKESARPQSLLMKLGPKTRHWLPTAISLASIPVIAPIIDRSMDFLMNHTVRKMLKMPPTHHRLHFDELHTARFHKNPNQPKNAPPIYLTSHYA